MVFVWRDYCFASEDLTGMPAYRRHFRGGKSIFSLWRLSRFVTKPFIYYVEAMLVFQ